MLSRGNAWCGSRLTKEMVTEMVTAEIVQGDTDEADSVQADTMMNTIVCKEILTRQTHAGTTRPECTSTMQRLGYAPSSTPQPLSHAHVQACGCQALDFLLSSAGLPPTPRLDCLQLHVWGWGEGLALERIHLQALNPKP